MELHVLKYLLRVQRAELRPEQGGIDERTTTYRLLEGGARTAGADGGWTWAPEERPEFQNLAFPPPDVYARDGSEPRGVATSATKPEGGYFDVAATSLAAFSMNLATDFGCDT